MKNGTTEQIRRILRDAGLPIPIREIIDALPDTLDRHAIVRLISKMRATGEVTTSMVDKAVHYALVPDYVPQRKSSPLHGANAPKLPPAPIERSESPAEAPPGPAPVATSSSPPPRAPEAQAEPPAASDHVAAVETSSSPSPRVEAHAAPSLPAASAAAEAKTLLSDVLDALGKERCAPSFRVAMDGSSPAPFAAEVGALADDFTAVVGDAAADIASPESLARLIQCVASANRLAGLMGVGR